MKDIETGNKYPTLLFNGYEEWVSSLVQMKKIIQFSIDVKKFFCF